MHFRVFWDKTVKGANKTTVPVPKLQYFYQSGRNCAYLGYKMMELYCQFALKFILQPRAAPLHGLHTD